MEPYTRPSTYPARPGSPNKPLRYALAAVLVATGVAVAFWYFQLRIPGNVQKFREPILSYTRDPESSVFRNDVIRSRPHDRAYCGEINTKNGAGGLTGFRRFIVEENGELVWWEGEGVFDKKKNRLGESSSLLIYRLRLETAALNISNTSRSRGAGGAVSKYAATPQAEREMFENKWGFNCI